MASGDSLCIKNGLIYTPLKVIENGVLLIHKGKIKQVGSESQVNIPRNSTVIDADKHIVCPGFLDLQVNGGGGVFLTEDASYNGVCAVAKTHVKFGTTGILPTIITAETNIICTALKAVNEAVVKGTEGANVLGSHLEGPFINEERKGIHESKFIKKPSILNFDAFFKASQATLKILTLAPEIEGSLGLIRHARKRGVLVSVGHSTANYSQVQSATDAGLTLGTHVFNAMNGIDSREPGTVGAILSNDQIKTSLIADEIHVHPMSMKIVINAKGIDKVFLVTDSMPPIGTTIKAFKLFDKTIHVKDGACHNANGTIAGSVSSMNVSIKVIHEKVGIPLNWAIAMATEIPASIIGISDKKGSLAVGKDADITLCDSDMQIMKVIVGGKTLYEK